MKKIIGIVLFFLFSLNAIAQYRMKRNNGQWFIGGDFRYSANSNNSAFSISPELTYLWDNGFEAGLGIGYSQLKSGDLKSRTIAYGPVIGYNIIENIFLRGQLQQLTGRTTGNGQSITVNETSIWLGGGYRMFDNSGIVSKFGFIYNVLYNENNSIYSSPVLPFVSVSYGL